MEHRYDEWHWTRIDRVVSSTRSTDHAWCPRDNRPFNRPTNVFDCRKAASVEACEESEPVWIDRGRTFLRPRVDWCSNVRNEDRPGSVASRLQATNASGIDLLGWERETYRDWVERRRRISRAEIVVEEINTTRQDDSIWRLSRECNRWWTNTCANTRDFTLHISLPWNEGASTCNPVPVDDPCPTRVRHRSEPNTIDRREPLTDAEHNATAWTDSCPLVVSSIEWHLERRFRSSPPTNSIHLDLWFFVEHTCSSKWNAIT